MAKKNIYLTLDTETFGGASKPKGIYHLAGIIHDRQGNIISTFNYLIGEHFHEINADEYAKKNFKLYLKMILEGKATFIPTEKEAVNAVLSLCRYYEVSYVMAYNSAFDFTKTKCKELLNYYPFIDIQLIALQTVVQKKGYQKFCQENKLCATSKKKCKTSAESVYAYLTNNPIYKEEHTAFEDSKIEKDIFVACMNSHKKFDKNIHWFDYVNDNSKWDLIPPFFWEA